jgi:hypothetical protein
MQRTILAALYASMLLDFLHRVRYATAPVHQTLRRRSHAAYPSADPRDGVHRHWTRVTSRSQGTAEMGGGGRCNDCGPGHLHRHSAVLKLVRARRGHCWHCRNPHPYARAGSLGRGTFGRAGGLGVVETGHHTPADGVARVGPGAVLQQEAARCSISRANALRNSYMANPNL